PRRRGGSCPFRRRRGADPDDRIADTAVRPQYLHSAADLRCPLRRHRPRDAALHRNPDGPSRANHPVPADLTVPGDRIVNSLISSDVIPHRLAEALRAPAALSVAVSGGVDSVTLAHAAAIVR